MKISRIVQNYAPSLMPKPRPSRGLPVAFAEAVFVMLTFGVLMLLIIAGWVKIK